MANSDELLHSVSGQREHETSFKVTKEGQVRMCWRKLDRKSKKLNFSFQVNDKSMNNIAGQDTLDVLNQELSNIQERLDSISRNLYLQQDMDKQHFERKKNHTCLIVILSDTIISIDTNMDVSPQNVPCVGCLRSSGILHYFIFQVRQGWLRQHNA